jgi:hypothetical protein
LSSAGVSPSDASADGYALSFAIAAGVTAFGALVGFFGIRDGAPQQPVPAPATRQGEPVGSAASH